MLNLTGEKSLSCGFASLVLHSGCEWRSSKEYIITAADHSKWFTDPLYRSQKTDEEELGPLGPRYYPVQL